LINMNDVKLIVAGQPWGSFDKYFQIINRHELNVRLFLNYVSEDIAVELFKIADVVIYPYKEFEASSGAVSIALFFKKAIVVTNVGGLSDVAKVIARAGDSDDLSDKIKFALENQKMLEAFSRRIAESLRWDKIAEKHRKIYERLMQ